ncbi:hypothetical protein Cadr_000022470 [Camelus dromedarius]|uniref:Uncharacterized protein n=1 Tax=Camelus dromedarius TaxID=9838 RepID=A0A5N4CRB2_CAMDR|nr:hypothetical protein Cadr_000022470 [Camelus dromedarius]
MLLGSNNHYQLFSASDNVRCERGLREPWGAPSHPQRKLAYVTACQCSATGCALGSCGVPTAARRIWTALISWIEEPDERSPRSNLNQAAYRVMDEISEDAILNI